MIWQTTAAIVAAGVMVLGMLGSVLILVFRIGTLSGKIDSFMATYERDRSDILKDQGRLEERLNRHIETHERRLP